MADPLETRASPCVTLPNLVVLRQTVQASVQRSPGKRVRSFKVTQGHRHRQVLIG